MLRDPEDGDPELILMASGTEVHVAHDALKLLVEDGVKVRLVSMPCLDRFVEQDQAYRDSVLPPAVKARVAVEAAAALGWHRWVGDLGDVVAMEGFGASAPAGALYKHFGFTGENVAARARAVLERTSGRPPSDDPGGRSFASVRSDPEACRKETSMSDVTTIEADVPERYAEAVSTRLRRAADEDVVGRLWRRDGTLWAPEGTPEVTNRLGWLDIAEREREALDDYTSFAEGLRAEGYRDAVVLGMGGSSLAPEVFRQSFGKLDHGLRLHVLDSTHPGQVREVLNSIELDRALMIVSSKSGGTIEPMSMFKAFFERQGDGTHFAAVTDPGSSLEALAGKHGFRRVFAGDPDIGGRYSALSPFGLVPAAAAGIDVAAILDSAIGAAEECRGEQGNAGLWLGCALGELARQGRDKLTFVVDAPLTAYGLWAEQLVAESTGKLGRGILPIADEPLLEPGAYGDDRVFAHIALDDSANASKLQALKDAGHPVITIRALGASRPRADLLPVGVRRRRRGLGAGDQPVRPAQRPGGQGQHQPGAGGGFRRARGRQPERAHRRPAAAVLRRDHGLPAVRRRDRSRRRAPADRADAALSTWPRRGATAPASCTPPDSSTRAARRPAASCNSWTSPPRTSRSRASRIPSGR